MAVTTAAAAHTQALTGIRTAAASPREDTQTMTGISTIQLVRYMDATLMIIAVGAVGAVTHQVGSKG